ncbi:putative diguanylate cyclase YdaM [Marinomonas aquimarina]|uniref:Putative diguanylate cyclase YdaM n=1 Tax=Marinomonas aquimarina TaxID=295068 RepID=A0A1A8TNP2_9GAMM|nr:sensor domain-containing diguanylate cyclase [Marinomonas aquimarina]SBS34859.1 putative diguanylate cyclase YdaM [Marinomonas aquimarina]
MTDHLFFTPSSPLENSIDDLKTNIRQEQSVWHFLFENSPEAIVLIDRYGSVVDANQAFSDMLGYTRTETHQLHLWDWDDNLEKNVALELLNNPSGKGVTFETFHRCKDQSIKSVEISSSSTSLDGQPLVICFCRDTTEKKQRDQRIQELILRDPLTNLLNRRAFNYRTKRALQHAQEYQQEFSMLLVDIDHFKMINDEHGHSTGDQVLAEVATMMASQVRDKDSIARWGGEEFALILPGTDQQSAADIGERLRQSFANLQVGNIALISASIGVTSYQAGDTLDSLFKRVDDAMYRAKQCGRNCVMVSP